MRRMIEDFFNFQRRQACPYIEVHRGDSVRSMEGVSVFLFANGASSDGRYSHRDAPTTGTPEWDACRRAYVFARLQEEESLFELYRMQALTDANNHELYPHQYGPVSRQQLRELVQGKKRIERLREELTSLDQRLRDQRKEARASAESEIQAVQREEAARMTRRLRRLSIGDRVTGSPGEEDQDEANE